MNENIEILEYIYKNAEMGYTSSYKLLNSLKGKENKIKKSLENITNEYKKYRDESKRMIKKSKINLDGNSIITKITSSFGIQMEVNKDNSDAAIAHLMIQGLTMGCVDIESKINRFKNAIDKRVETLANNYLKFQNDSIEYLKQFL